MWEHAAQRQEARRGALYDRIYLNSCMKEGKKRNARARGDMCTWRPAPVAQSLCSIYPLSSGVRRSPGATSRRDQVGKPRMQQVLFDSEFRTLQGEHACRAYEGDKDGK